MSVFVVLKRFRKVCEFAAKITPAQPLFLLFYVFSELFPVAGVKEGFDSLSDCTAFYAVYDYSCAVCLKHLLEPAHIGGNHRDSVIC